MQQFFDDLGTPQMGEEFAHVTAHVLAATALGDMWATPASGVAFMAGYRGTHWQAMLAWFGLLSTHGLAGQGTQLV